MSHTSQVFNGAVADRIQAVRAQAMARVEQARARVRSRIAPGGGTSGTILDTVRAARTGGAILPEVRRRIEARTPLIPGLGMGRGAVVGSSAAVSSLRDESTPGTGVVVRKILV